MQFSIVGTWNGLVDWGCQGSTASAGPWTFKADGTWTYSFGGGRWVQVGDMVCWNFTNAPGLIYCSNLSRDSMQGIMGYASASPNPGTGCFYGLRQGKLAAFVEDEAKKADATVGHVKK